MNADPCGRVLTLFVRGGQNPHADHADSPLRAAHIKRSAISNLNGRMPAERCHTGRAWAPNERYARLSEVALPLHLHLRLVAGLPEVVALHHILQLLLRLRGHGHGIDRKVWRTH